MKRLLLFLHDYRTESILAPLFKMLEAFFDLLVPIVVARIINIGIAGGDQAYILREAGVLILLAAAGMLSSFTAQYFAAKAAVGFGTKVRQAVFDHIQHLSYTELDQLGTGTLITRLTSDINQVQTGVNMGLRLLLRSPFIVFGSVIMAFTIDVKCALIFLAAVPILLAVVYGIMVVAVPMYRKVQMGLDRITGLTRENLTGVRVIRAFGRERDSVKEFDEANRVMTMQNEKVGAISALLNPVTYVLINLATILLIQRGAIQVNLGSIQQGDVVALYNYMAQMIVELIKLASLILTLNKSLACADRVADILDVKSSMQYPEESREGDHSGSVVFDHVSFSYQGAGAESLTDISFSAAPGSTIGIIGGTGSGKSTLVNLIPRFYDPESGTVSVDGVNVKDYGEGELIAKIGVVPQKAELFAGTIRDNLKWGNEYASEEQLEEAVRTAQAEEVVNGKVGKLDYMLEQNGRNLSGGQKQRLTIARALVKRPEILILDDSASALDFATDARLRKSLRSLPHPCTTFIVSQRCSSIMQADQILVLNDGKLAGKGTHEELMQNCEIYQEIFYSQFPEKKPEGKAVLA